MSTIRCWFNSAANFIHAALSMITMPWQAQPICFVGLIVIICLQGLIPLGTAWLTKVLFDLLSQNMLRHQATPTLNQHLILLLLAQAGLMIISQLIGPLNQYLHAELERQLSLKSQTTIYQKLNSFVGLSYFEDAQFQNTIQLAIRSAHESSLQSLAIVTNLLQGTVTVVTFLGVVIAFNPLLAGVIGVAVLPQLYIQLRFSSQRFGVAFDNSPKERLASYYGQALSWIAFAKEIRLFNLGDYFLKSFIQITEEIQQTQRAQQHHELRWQLPLSLLASIVTVGAFVVVILQAFTEHFSLGDVALYTSAVISIQSALLNMIGALSLMKENTLFYHHYTNLLALSQPLAIAASVQNVPPLTSGITLHDVSFRYNDEHSWVLRHVNLFLPAGQCLALVGANGVGKTTLTKLLARFYDPTEGKILWDGIDLRKFDPRELRQHMAAIFQDFAHYDLTIEQNIGLGNIAQIENSDVVQQAAKKAGIHERILAFPRGYQSFLGRWLAHPDAGIDLSGGEWQKIALARMFMRDAALLILDEPTASLDAQAEYDLYAHFRELMRGRTSLLITHRFSTVRMADQIAVLEHGRITEYGTHEELLSHQGTYASLYMRQAAAYQ
ncbi:MAG: ABC transporter ATP-binding protein [Ktedonobacteraceae bacterium]